MKINTYLPYERLMMSLKSKLVVGAQIKLGADYCKNRACKAGDIITLVEGTFEYDNGLYDEYTSCPAVWDERTKEFDSIYHLFGNELEDFADCEIVSVPKTSTITNDNKEVI
jgi:hypothetical protein